MIMSESMRIYTCDCKTRGVKSKSRLTKEGYPVFLCKKCLKQLTNSEGKEL